MADSSLQDKQAKAHAIVATTTAAAALTGGIPVPFADMIPLIGEQVAMLGGITAVFGFDLEKNALTSLVYAALSVSGATFVGKTVVSSLLKVIPFVGTGAGIAVSATTAGTLTLIIGEAYIKLMSGIAESGEKFPSLKELIEQFKELVKNEQWERENQPPENLSAPASESEPEPQASASESEPEPQTPAPESEPEPQTSAPESEPEPQTSAPDPVPPPTEPPLESAPQSEPDPAPPFKIRFEE